MNKQSCSTMTLNDSSHFVSLQCLTLGSGGDLSESLVKEGKCVLLVTRVSPPWNVQTVICLSPIFFLVQRNHSNFHLLPPPLFFFWSIFSLSLSLLPSTSFLFLSAKASTQKTNPIIKTNIYRAGPVFIHQNNMVIFLLLFFFFFLSTKASEYC